MDAVNGIKKKIEFERVELCKTCSGTGGFAERCSNCKGNGYVMIRKHASVYHVPCDKCDGLGITMAESCQYFLYKY